MADATKTATIAQTPQLSRRERASYGAGAFGKDICFMLSSSWALYYFTTVMGMNPGAMGVILLVARIFDALNDPLMGVITAKTRTRWGKFRPWILWTAIPFGVLSLLAFSTPDLGDRGKVIYALTTYTLLVLVYASNNLPYSALSGVLTGNMEMSRKVGLRSVRRIPFFNGPIECRMVVYDLYEGGAHS